MITNAAHAARSGRIPQEIFVSSLVDHRPEFLPPERNPTVRTFLNGTLVSDIVLDTAPATDTIDYVVTDQNGLTSTSTRTVIIETVSE